MKLRNGARTGAAAVVLAVAAAAQESASNFKAALVVGDAQTHLRALLDYDGDGAQDALSVFGTPGAASGTLRGYRNVAGALVLDWTATFTPPSALVGGLGGAPVGAYAARADLNGDALDDFVFAAGAYVAAYVSNGAGAAPTLQWSWNAPGGVPAYALTTSDFDLDGLGDAAVVADGAPGAGLTVYVLRTVNGAGAPAVGPTFAVGGVNATMTTIDVDGVPPREIAVSIDYAILPGGVSTSVYGLVAGGGTALVHTSGSPGTAGAVAAGDLDGDGDEDLLATDVSLSVFSPPQRRILRNQGGTLVAQPPTLQSLRASFLFDVDGDGDLDSFSGASPIVPTGPRSVGDFRLTLHDATGAPVGSFDVAAIDGGAIGVADLDGDGDGDVVSPRSVYYSGGGVQPPTVHGATFAARVEVSDVEGDGDPDVPNGAAETLRNDGRGFFAPAVTAPLAGAGYVVVGRGARLDVDGDGDLDQLVVTAPTTGATANATRLRLNHGDGALIDVGAAAAVSMGDFGAGAALASVGPESAFVADLDADGDADVLVSGFAGGVAYARPWLNNGVNAFVAGATLTGFAAGGLADFDADGLPDLVGFATASNQGAAEVRRNAGGGAFLAPTAPGGWPALTGPLALVGRPAIGDFDGDGAVEVCVVEKPAGAPAFARTIELAGAAFVASSAFAAEADGFVTSGNGWAADADRDGSTDVLLRVEAANGGATCVLLRTPSGFAAPQVELADAYGVADLDDDGDADLVGASRVAFGRRTPPFAGGLRLQYGVGSAGTGGVVPTFGAAGLRGAGDAFELRVVGLVGGAGGLLAVGLTELNAPLFGSTLLASPDVLVPFTAAGALGVAGAGTFDFAFTVPPGIAGVPFFHQAAVVDPAGPSGLAFSNGLRVVYGP